MINASDIVKLVITSISAIDFLVFSALFITYLLVIPYKASSGWVKLGSILTLLFFTCFKILHIPAFLSTVDFLHVYIQNAEYILLGLTWTNIMLAIVPLIAAIITFTRSWRLRDNDTVQYKYTKVNIVMPIYNEDPIALEKAVKSVQNLDYNMSNVKLYLAFDDDQEPDAWVHLMKLWKLYNQENRD